MCYHSVGFHDFVKSLGSEVSGKLKLIRYMDMKWMDEDGRYRKSQVCYHRDTPIDGEWWMNIATDDAEQIYTEGCTPEIVPVPKWDWEKPYHERCVKLITKR